MANYHVTKNNGNGWNVMREGAQRASSVFDTQAQAIKEAKNYAGNNGGGEVRIHDRHNIIRDSDTVPPAHDPFPPKG